MTVLIPSKKIALRWNGALQARLRRAPLENFLLSRGQKCVLTGPHQITDNLASATIYFVDKALSAHTEKRGPVPASRHPVVGQIACAVSRSLSSLIQEPASWRISGLVGTARVLAPYVGLDAAAHLAASAARDYSRSLGSCAPDMHLLQVSHGACVAVDNNDETLAANTVHLILQCLSSMPCRAPAENRYAAAISDHTGQPSSLTT